MFTKRMIKSDTALEHLNETYITYVYFTKPTRALFAFFSNSSDVAFLIILGINSQIFGAREDMARVPKILNDCIFFLELNSSSGY